MSYQQHETAGTRLMDSPRSRNSHAPEEERLPNGAGLRLSVLRNALDWSTRDLLPGHYTIGSDPQCDLVVNAQGVAPRHCTLIVGHQRNIVKAWAPKTWINDGIVREGTLRVGDHLIVGPVEFSAGPIPASAFRIDPPVGRAAPEDLHRLLGNPQPRQRLLKETQSSLHREAQIQELLSEVQHHLDQVLQKERDVRDELMRERLVLKHRANELDQQQRMLEKARTHLSAQQLQEKASGPVHSPDVGLDIQKRQQELKRLEALLEERYDELASRTRSLVQFHRQLKSQQAADQEREQRQKDQLASIRSLLARNNAQARQLSKRQREIELYEVAYQERLSKLSETRSDLDHQIRLHEEERKQWQSKCRSRERLLDDLEQTISSRLQEIEEEASRLSNWSRKLAAQETEITNRLRQIESRAFTVERSVDDLEKERKSLDAERAALENERNELESARQEWEQSRETTDSQVAQINEKLQKIEERESLISEREAALNERLKAVEQAEGELKQRQESLVQDQEEIFRQREEVAQRESELEERQKEFEQKQKDLQEETAKLKEKEKRLAQQSEELEASRADLQARLQQSQDEAKAVMSESDATKEHLAQLQQNLEDLEAKLTAQAEQLKTEQTQLEQAREQLQNAESDLEAERQNFARLRSELDAERERGRYEQEQLRIAQTRLEQAQLELQQQQEDLNAEKQAHQAAQQEWEVQKAAALASAVPAESIDPQERERLESERRELEAFRERLHAEQETLSERINAFEKRQAEIATTEEKLAEERRRLQTLESELISEQKRIADSREDLERDRQHLLNEREQLQAERNELQARQSAIESSAAQLPLSVETPIVESDPREDDAQSLIDATGAIGDRVAGTDENESDLENVDSPSMQRDDEASDEEALKLRSELASMFGLPLTSPPASEESSPAARRRRRREASQAALNKENPAQPAEEATTPATPPKPEEVSAEASVAASGCSSPSDDDSEISVEAYMERLLARTRQPDASAPVPTREAASAPKPQIAEPEGSDEAESKPAEEPVVRKVRKLDEGAKQSLRANIHSFREVANQSARTAVAKSTYTRKTSSLRSMTILNFIGWAATAGLLGADRFLGKPMYYEALSVGGVSTLLTVLCLFRIKEIHKITKHQKALIKGEGNRSSNPVDSAQKEEEQSGPLAFL